MAAPYTTPTVNDTKGFYEFFNYVNTTADGMFFPMLMGIIWCILFVTGKAFVSNRAFMFASFMCSILGIILAVLDLISPLLMYFFIIMTALGVLWIKLSEQVVQ